MDELVRLVGFVNLALFVLLGAVAVRQWLRRRSVEARWLGLAFGTLGAVVVLGRFVPANPDALGARALQRLDVVALLLFPALLYAFTTAFAPPSRALRRAAVALTATIVAWTLALPDLPAADEPHPWWFTAYVVGFVVHWAVLSTAAAWRLWSAGRGQPTVSRRRMQSFAAAAAAITLAIACLAAADEPDAPMALAAALLGLASGIAFLAGLAPPQVLRMLWRRPEQARLHAAIAELMTLASTQEEVAERVIEPTVEIVGARALAIRNGEGKVVAAQGTAIDAPPTLSVEAAGASLDVWTSPYAPYFGDDERRLLTTLAALTGIALDRVRLFAQEREARIALERANDVRTNFVALAAHELRTPVTTIHGFVTTLDRLEHRLSEAQRLELRTALGQQTERMAALVEQLLDLSRLDADAIEIRPRPLDVASHLRDVVAIAAGARAHEVSVEADPALRVRVDAAALERALSNLVTNAFRYGTAPVLVTAALAGGALRVSVADRGPGVPPEFVVDLFERFTRSGVARDRAPGTGLGLAIARSYARAHGGDLVYDPPPEGGARFTIVLPAERMDADASTTPAADAPVARDDAPAPHPAPAEAVAEGAAPA